MIKWFYKYGFILLLLNTILYSIDLNMDNKPDYKFLADIIFYLVMGLGSVILFINPSQIKDVVFHKSFVFLLLINLLNIIYFIFIEDQYNKESFYFLISKFIQFFLISLAIYHNYDYYRNRFPSLLIYSISFVILLGFFFNLDIFSGTYNGVFWNRNMLASLTGIGFVFLLLGTEYRISKNLKIILFILMILISILTGTRTVFLFIAFALLYKYGFSIRNILYSILGLVLLLSIQHRVLYSDLDRFSQWQEAIYNIKASPWFGYGLLEYDGDLEELSEYKYNEEIYGGAHNAYLSFFIQYGVIFGSLIIFIIIRKSLLLFYRLQYMSHTRIYMCIITITLVASMFETFMTGINEFQTVLFWFSLSFLSYSKFLEDYAD